MPKRSNEFQRVIRLIEEQLVPAGCTVTESAMVPQHRSGRPSREVDVLITVTREGKTIGVECTDTSRPVDVSWVERMHGKHLKLTTDKLILVARAGFTPEARQSATDEGHMALTLEDAASLDWAEELERFGASFLEGIELSFRGYVQREDGTRIGGGGVRLFDNADRLVGTIDRALSAIINEPRIVTAVRELLKADGDKKVDLRVEAVAPNGGPLFARINESDAPTRVGAFVLHLDTTKTTVSLAFKDVAYDETLVSFAESAFADGRATVAVVRDASGRQTGRLLRSDGKGKDKFPVVKMTPPDN